MDPNQPQVVSNQQVYGQPLASNKVVSSRGWHNTKIVFGALSMATCVVILGIAGALVTQFPLSYYAYIDLALAYSPAILAGAWQIAEFITLCVRRDRGIHPGAHVALHLLIWLGAAAATGFLTTIVIVDQECDYYCRRYSGFGSSSSSRYQSYLGLETALCSFMYILLIIHFTLFVRACIECARRNSRTHTVVMIQPGQPGVYYVPAQPHPQMAQPYPVQYMQPPQHPQSVYAPPQPTSSHNSMYGFYGSPQTQQSHHAPIHEGKAELHSQSPVVPSVTPASSDAADHRHYSTGPPELSSRQ